MYVLLIDFGHNMFGLLNIASWKPMTSNCNFKMTSKVKCYNANWYVKYDLLCVFS